MAGSPDRPGPLGRLFSAVAFAEAGEFDTARTLVADGSRRVVLAVGAEAPSETTLQYAINCCERVGASLELFHERVAAGHWLTRLREELTRRGIACRLVQVRRDLRREVVDYVRAHRAVMFVVLDGGQAGSAKAWHALACPLVVTNRGN